MATVPRHNRMIQRAELEDAEEWHKVELLIRAAPPLKFHPEWDVRIVPPFNGAVARFVVTDSSNSTVGVSAYLDFNNSLGFESDPYWEIYPYRDDTWRCKYDATDELMTAIAASMAEQRGHGKGWNTQEVRHVSD